MSGIYLSEEHQISLKSNTNQQTATLARNDADRSIERRKSESLSVAASRSFHQNSWAIDDRIHNEKDTKKRNEGSGLDDDREQG